MFEKLVVEIPCLNARARSLWYHPFRKEHLLHQCQNNSHATGIHLPQKLCIHQKRLFHHKLFTRLVHWRTFAPTDFYTSLLPQKPFALATFYTDTDSTLDTEIHQYLSILLSIGYYIIEYWEDHSTIFNQLFEHLRSIAANILFEKPCLFKESPKKWRTATNKRPVSICPDVASTRPSELLKDEEYELTVSIPSIPSFHDATTASLVGCLLRFWHRLRAVKRPLTPEGEKLHRNPW